MNDKNIIVNKPEPKPGILERGDLFAIAVGMVIGSGMVTLIGPAMAYTGYSVWLAYLTAIVMGFFMVFPYIILLKTISAAASFSYPEPRRASAIPASKRSGRPRWLDRKSVV